MGRWLVGLCIAAALMPATARGSATHFQANAAYDGNAGAGVTPPLRPAWTARVDGIPSYALIAQGRVFVVVDGHEWSPSPGLQLVALSARTGRTLWRQPLPGDETGIAYDGGRVYASLSLDVDEPGGITAYDAATGNVVWRAPFGTGSGDPPTADRGAVYTRMGENLDAIAAVRQTDGSVLWAFPSSNGTEGTFAVSDDVLYAALPCEEVLALRRTDGAELWRTPRVCAGGGGSAAVFASGRVFSREGFGIRPGEIYDAGTGRRLATWPHDYPPAVAGRVGIFADGFGDKETTVRFGYVMRARDLNSGRVLWRFEGDGYLQGPPLIAGRTVFVGSGSGRVYGVSLKSGRVVWRTSLGVPVNAWDEWQSVMGGLAAADGLLLVPAYGRVAAFRSR